MYFYKRKCLKYLSDEKKNDSDRYNGLKIKTQECGCQLKVW